MTDRAPSVVGPQLHVANTKARPVGTGVQDDELRVDERPVKASRARHRAVHGQKAKNAAGNHNLYEKGTPVGSLAVLSRVSRAG